VERGKKQREKADNKLNIRYKNIFPYLQEQKKGGQTASAKRGGKTKKTKKTNEKLYLKHALKY